MKLGKGFLLSEVGIAALVVLVITVNAIVRLHRNDVVTTNDATTVGPSLSNQSYPQGADVACKLTKLGEHKGMPGQHVEKYIDSTLASGTKSGYTFHDVICRSRMTGLTVSRGWGAAPNAPGQTGQRYFCSDQTGAIKFDTDSIANCMVNGKSL